MATDYEKRLSLDDANPPIQENGESLHKGLETRHVTMIALGGALGTGLLIGT